MQTIGHEDISMTLKSLRPVHLLGDVGHLPVRWPILFCL